MPSSRRTGDAQCAWWSKGAGGRWARSPGQQGWPDRVRSRARPVTPVPSTELGVEVGGGGRGKRRWRRLRNDIEGQPIRAHGCARAATSADRRRSRARPRPSWRGGGSELRPPRAPPSPGHRLPRFSAPPGFRRLLRASWGTKTADPARRPRT